MIPNGKQYKVWFLLTVISLLIVGCAPSPEETLENASITEPNSEVKPSSKPVVDHHTKNHLTVSSKDQPAAVVNPKDEATKDEATKEKVVVADETKSQSQSTDAKVYNVTEDYDVSNPTLMGFTMNATTDQVLERFGKPLSESIMNDGSDPLQIYEYPGFIIGFNSANQIVFIEVNSSEVNPGLNDLHIGQTVEEARHSLGTPDSLNEYVMIYSSNHLIMKLDIDPNSNIIRSIKLFAE
ncbi:MAG: DUF4309 domain-containing protein [Paenibacillaceae bacterium]